MESEEHVGCVEGGHALMWTWHVAEMGLSAVRRFQRQLQKLGATDIQVPLAGYVLWKGDRE